MLHNESNFFGIFKLALFVRSTIWKASARLDEQYLRKHVFTERNICAKRNDSKGIYFSALGYVYVGRLARSDERCRSVKQTPSAIMQHLLIFKFF